MFNQFLNEGKENLKRIYHFNYHNPWTLNVYESYIFALKEHFKEEKKELLAKNARAEL